MSCYIGLFRTRTLRISTMVISPLPRSFSTLFLRSVWITSLVQVLHLLISPEIFWSENTPFNYLPERVILEVLEDITIDRQLIEALQGLKKSGFQIAMDDVVDLNRLTPALSNGLINVVKIDLMGTKRILLPDMVNTFKQYGMLLLAEKVETLEDYDLCYRLGFDFFQGYYLCKPNIVKGRKMESSRLIVMRLLAQVTDPKADFQSLEALVTTRRQHSVRRARPYGNAYEYALSHLQIDGFRSFSFPIAKGNWRHLRRPNGLPNQRAFTACLCRLLGVVIEQIRGSENRR